MRGLFLPRQVLDLAACGPLPPPAPSAEAAAAARQPPGYLVLHDLLGEPRAGTGAHTPGERDEGRAPFHFHYMFCRFPSTARQQLPILCDLPPQSGAQMGSAVRLFLY